jgi:hypothetical protein
MKLGSMKAKAEWMTTPGVIPAKECFSLESPVQ